MTLMLWWVACRELTVEVVKILQLTRDSLDTFSTMDTVLGTLALYLGIISDNILAKETHNNHYLLVMSCVDPKTVWF